MIRSGRSPQGTTTMLSIHNVCTITANGSDDWMDITFAPRTTICHQPVKITLHLYQTNQAVGLNVPEFTAALNSVLRDFGLAPRPRLPMVGDSAEPEVNDSIPF